MSVADFVLDYTPDQLYADMARRFGADLRADIFSSGPKDRVCVRLTHVPTGETVETRGNANAFVGKRRAYAELLRRLSVPEPVEVATSRVVPAGPEEYALVLDVFNQAPEDATKADIRGQMLRALEALRLPAAAGQ